MSGVAVTRPTYARARPVGRSRTHDEGRPPRRGDRPSRRPRGQFGWTKTATVRAGTENELLPASYAACLTTLSAPFAWTALSETAPLRPGTFWVTASGVALKTTTAPRSAGSTST